MKKPTGRSGFTLVELSIVLVVLGLIVGGIFAAQSMIRNAQLKKVTAEMQIYVTAISNFRNKYYALPGDFSGATALWGDSGGDTVSGTPPETRDGDGDARITSQTVTSTFVEQFRAWQHLANAKMVEGSYSGIATVDSTQLRVVGTNIPASQLSGAGWGLVTILQSDSAINLDVPYNTGDIPLGTVLWFGGNSSTDNATRNYMEPMLAPDEALLMDQKIDDGIPTTGKVVAQTNLMGTACYASNAYSTTNSNRICTLIFKTGL